MQGVLLVTSIPPRLSRLDARGVEIGADYQRTCIASWRQAGFEPMSVNAARELCDYPELRDLPVHIATVERDAVALTGRPLIFISDLLSAAAKEAQGRPFALVNADVLLAPSFDLAARVARLVPNEFLFARRIDIREPTERTGARYPFGYDFFAMHADDLLEQDSSEMVFGAPWWDHHLPLALHTRGCRLTQMHEPLAFHLTHTERWDQSIWEILGRRFITEIGAGKLPAGYASRFEDALRKRVTASWQNFQLGQRVSGNEVRDVLNRVSSVNLAFLDAHT